MSKWWSGRWESLFEQAESVGSTTGPTLGVNYVQASAPFATLEVQGTSLVVGQDLAKHGVAGVVWNCVRSIALDRARAMVAFFEAEPQLVAQRHVLELGAGPGAVGLALSSVCDVSSLLLTDLESVVPLIRENVRVAAEHHAAITTLASSSRLGVRPLCWGEPVRAIDTFPVDVVVASDCLYESASHSGFLATLLELTDRSKRDSLQHVIVFLAYKQRMPTKEKEFFESAAKHFAIAVYSTGSSSSSGNNDRADAVEFYDEAIYMCKLEHLHSGKHATQTQL